MLYGNLNLSDLIIENNTGYANGAGIAIQNSNSIINNVIVRNNNIVGGGNGGGLYVNAANVQIINSIFDSNSGYDGGAVFANNTTLIIRDSAMFDNYSNNNGGAISTIGEDGINDISYSLFYNNYAFEGGAFIITYNILLHSLNYLVCAAHYSST